MALIKELETLIHVGRHPNIVSLVGACTFEGKALAIRKVMRGRGVASPLLFFFSLARRATCFLPAWGGGVLRRIPGVGGWNRKKKMKWNSCKGLIVGKKSWIDLPNFFQEKSTSVNARNITKKKYSNLYPRDSPLLRMPDSSSSGIEERPWGRDWKYSCMENLNKKSWGLRELPYPPLQFPIL